MSEISQKSVLDKLKTRGYWRIELRPTKFQKEQFTLKECKGLIEQNQVRLRGWYFPHMSINHGDFFNAEDHVVGFVNWSEHCEIFKMYRSGQFVYYLNFWEDWINYSPYGFNVQFENGKTRPNVKEVIMTLYTVTEIFLFASRLASSQFGDKTMHLSIELKNCENRGLILDQFGRSLNQLYICKIPEFKIVKDIPLQEIITNYASLALDTTFEIFQHFNWDYSQGTKDALKHDQDKILLKA